MTNPVRSKERFLVFGSPDLQEPEIEEVVASLRSGWIGTGPKVAKFERDFADYVGAPHAVAVNSCTAALHLSLLASNLRPGDEVITTAMTFCATVNAIIHSGATPVLVDIDPKTMNIDPAKVVEAITSRTRAIIPVHFAGRPCDMDALCEICAQHNIIMIEDCAHAIETTYRGRHAGTFGTFGCFSFYVTKNVVTGEGGMIIVRDEELSSRLKVLGLHGMSKDAWKRFGDEGYKHYQVIECGFKYNMMDIQAAIGIHQLQRVEHIWQRRKAIWQQYDSAFADLPITLPLQADTDTTHAYHLYTILVDSSTTGITRDDFLDAMTWHNIGVGVHYLSVAEHPYYQRTFGWDPEDYPNAMSVGRQTVSLPLSSKLSDEDVQDVIQAVRLIVSKS